MEEIKDYQDSMKFDPMMERLNISLSARGTEMQRAMAHEDEESEEAKLIQFRRMHKLCVNDGRTGFAHDGENFYCKHCVKAIRKERRNPKYYPVVGGKSIGRNDPCPCGSGQKYKQCCLNSKKIG